MTTADEADIQHIDSDFLTGAGVVDLATDCIVTQDTGSNRNVLISSGVVYVRNSAFAKAQGLARFITGEVDSSTTLAIDPNTTLATRIDYVCAKYDSAVTPDAQASNSVISIVNVKGTVNGVAPTLPSNHIPLAQLTLALNFTGIGNADITDLRVQTGITTPHWNLVDKSEDPLAVTGTLAIVQYVSATSIKIFGDWRNVITKYTKLKFFNVSLKYFMATDTGSFSGGYTTYTISGGGVYTLANAAIRQVYYSSLEYPIGFPTNFTQTLEGVTLSTGSKFDVNADAMFSMMGLYKQAIVNANMDVWQDGSSVTFSGAGYGADMFKVVHNSGSSVTVARDTDVPSNGKSQYSMKISTVLGNTQSCDWMYHLEGADAKKFSGQQITFAFDHKESIGAGGSLGSTGTVFVVYASALENWSSQEVATSTTFNVSSSYATASVNLTLPATSASGYNISNGVRIIVRFTNSSASATLTSYTTQVRLNIGSFAFPLSPKSYEEELRACQRHYEKSYGQSVTPGTATQYGAYNSGAKDTFYLYAGAVRFAVTKRAVPTITFYSTNNANTTGVMSEYNGAGTFTANRTIALVGGSAQDTGFIAIGAGTLVANNNYYYQWTASARL